MGISDKKSEKNLKGPPVLTFKSESMRDSRLASFLHCVGLAQERVSKNVGLIDQIVRTIDVHESPSPVLSLFDDPLVEYQRGNVNWPGSVGEIEPPLGVQDVVVIEILSRVQDTVAIGILCNKRR